MPVPSHPSIPDPPSHPVTAELVIPVSESDVVEESAPVEAELVHAQTGRSSRSWVFRCVDAFTWICTQSFGIVSVILIIAILANIPILQFIAFGYLLAVSGRVATSGRLRDGLIHLDKASKVGSIFIGTMLILVPARLLSWFHNESYLIDPESWQTRTLGVSLVVVIVLTIPHIMAAWFCGGRLRYFFWPMIAPFSIALWLAKKAAGSDQVRPLLQACTSWISPNFVNDLVRAEPITDWFLPAILFKNIRNRTLISNARDQLWEFATSLEIGHFFKLGFFGLIGSFLWLAPPTLLMFRAIGFDDGLAVVCGLMGILLATVVFALLPFLQTRFAETGKLSSFLDLKSVYRRFSRAPLLHLIALLVLLLLALPLFAFKVEEIPSELLWTLSVIFVVFGFPGRLLTGWAVGRGALREKSRAWWYKWPLAMLFPVVSFAFAFIFFFSPFVAWYGGYSLFENHAFLLPAPFWVSFFV